VLLVLLFWNVLGLVRLKKNFRAAGIGLRAALVSFTVLALVPIETLCR